MSRKSRYNQDLLLQKSVRWIAGGYVRLSKEDKEHTDNSQSVLSQKQMIEKFLQAHPDIELYDYFVDDGYSGTDMERPEFQRMKQAFEDGIINCIIIKDLSRLARNDEESGKYIFIIFPFYNIRFISVNDHVDSYERPESVNNLEISFKNIMHSEYSRDLSKKVISASNIRRKRGEFVGAFCSYGYKKDPLDFHHLIIDEEPAEIVKYIFKRYLESQNIYAIAQELSENGVMTPLEYKKSKGENLFIPGKKINVSFWKDSTVKRILTNEVYTGCLVQGKRRKISYKSKKIVTMEESDWIKVENTHDAIIPQSTFDEVQRLIKQNYRCHSSPVFRNVFAGKLFCGQCGSAMSVLNSSQNAKLHYFVCKVAYKKKGLCEAKRMRFEQVEAIVLAVLNNYLRLCSDIVALKKKLLDKKKKEEEKLRKRKVKRKAQQQKLQSEKAELYAKYKEGHLTLEEYLGEKERIEIMIQSLDVPTDNSDEDVTSECTQSKDSLLADFVSNKCFNKVTKDLLDAFVERIEICATDRIEINLKFADEIGETLKYISENTDEGTSKQRTAI